MKEFQIGYVDTPPERVEALVPGPYMKAVPWGVCQKNTCRKEHTRWGDPRDSASAVTKMNNVRDQPCTLGTI